MRRLAAIAAASFALAGCPKKAPVVEDAGTSGNASADASASADAGATGKAEGGAGTAATSGAAYAGKYSVVAGKMYVPEGKDWSTVKFKNEESKFLGDGEITIAIDPAGRVTGATEGGPLGPAIIEGTRDGANISASIRRKDALDEGLTGTLVGNVSGDALSGTMKLSDLNAAVVREAKLEAKKK